MSDSSAKYEPHVALVRHAIALLRTEPDATLIAQLEVEQSAAATSLEWYGITGRELQRLVATHSLRAETRAAVAEALTAIRAIFTE